ncbi:MAG TPA: TetR family transcriptional regulator [Cytophagales bacterium]|nr:TetR family transcriptional regulator [Cytophagales bacterium]HRG08394.1 TetR family transcriptional regulator [Cyclobacteriaceae bacterium]
MGRKNLIQVRQKGIILAFYKVARKQGLENASIAKVADAMQVNPSLIMHYFKTKQDLIHGLIEYILERYRLIYTPLNQIADPQERLEQIIENLFSRKWDKLFDDGVFYSSFSLIFRDKKIKKHYKLLHDNLRLMLTETLNQCNDIGSIEVEDVEKTADLIFVFVEGAYYYLSMVSNKEEYNRKMSYYKQTVLNMLSLATVA